MSSLRRGSAVVVLAAGLVLGGCGSPDAGAPDTGSVGPRVSATDETGRSGSAPAAKLDTPELVALRKRAKIAPCPVTDTAGPAAPDGLPDVALPCLGGGPDVGLSALAEQVGKPVVLNVWAQWCKPCRVEAPHFQTLYERAGDRVQVLGIDYDDPRPELALAFAEELGLRYPQVADPDKRVKAAFGLLAGIPATVFVAADGRLVHVAHQTYQNERDLLADVRTHLGVAV